MYAAMNVKNVKLSREKKRERKRKELRDCLINFIKHTDMGRTIDQNGFEQLSISVYQ